MFDYARAMSEDGTKSSAIVGSMNHNFCSMGIGSEFVDGIEISRVRMYFKNLARRSVYLVSPAMLIKAFLKIKRSTNPVVLHIAEFRGIVPIYAIFLKSVFRRKIILVHSGFGMLHFKQSKLRIFYDQLFLSKFFKNVDLFFAQNTHEFYCYQEYLERYKLEVNIKKIQLLPLHVGKKHVSPINQVSKEYLRNKYDFNINAFIVVFLGRFHPEKGILRAIDAFISFADRFNQESLFLIIGIDQGFKYRIHKYILERDALAKIRIVENIYEDRFAYYKLADLFIGFPTIYEETMLASVEALACGTPIIVSKEADIPFIEEEGGGHVIDFSVGLAAEKMLEIALNPGSYHEKANATYMNNFTEDSVMKAFKSYLNASLN